MHLILMLHNTSSSAYIRNYQFVGEIISVSGKSASVSIKAKFRIGDEIELIFPDRNEDFSWKVDAIYSDDDELIDHTKPNTVCMLKLPRKIPVHGIIRIKL